MVQWDLGGEPLPYPTGVLNRFYLAVDPGASSPEAEEKSSALANESLSLSLMDADDEPSSSPMPSPGMALLSPSTVASGRKRRCDSEAGGSASPTKKPAAASKGKGKGKGKSQSCPPYSWACSSFHTGTVQPKKSCQEKSETRTLCAPRSWGRTATAPSTGTWVVAARGSTPRRWVRQMQSRP